MLIPKTCSRDRSLSFNWIFQRFCFASAMQVFFPNFFVPGKSILVLAVSSELFMTHCVLPVFETSCFRLSFSSWIKYLFNWRKRHRGNV